MRQVLQTGLLAICAVNLIALIFAVAEGRPAAGIISAVLFIPLTVAWHRSFDIEET